jgi:hypothetical protein
MGEVAFASYNVDDLCSDEDVEGVSYGKYWAWMKLNTMVR